MLELTYEEIRGMSERNKIELAKSLSKRANTRLSTLEKKGYDVNTWAYGKATRFLKAQGRSNNRFYEGQSSYYVKDGAGNKTLNNSKLNAQLQEVLTFLNSKTSTITGANEVLQKRFDTFASNQNFSERFNLNEPDPKDYTSKQAYNKAKKDFLLAVNDKYEDFYNFINSKKLDLLKKQVGDSGQVMDDFVRALQQGYSVDEIMKQYDEYSNSNMTFDQLTDRYQRSEWMLATNGNNLISKNAIEGLFERERERSKEKELREKIITKGKGKNARNKRRSNKRRK